MFFALLCFNSITKASNPPLKGAELPLLNIDPNYSDSIKAILKRERVLSLKKVSDESIIHEEFDSLGRMTYQEFRYLRKKKEFGFYSLSYTYYENSLVASRRIKSVWDDIIDTFNYDDNGTVVFYKQVIKTPSNKFKKTPLANNKSYDLVYKSHDLNFLRYSGTTVILFQTSEKDDGSKDSIYYTINQDNKIIHYKSKFLIDSTSIKESHDTIFESRWVKRTAYSHMAKKYVTTEYQLMDQQFTVKTECQNLTRIKTLGSNIEDVIYDGNGNKIYHSFGNSSHIYYEYGNSGLISRLNIQRGNTVEVYKYFYTYKRGW